MCVVYVCNIGVCVHVWCVCVESGGDSVVVELCVVCVCVVYGGTSARMTTTTTTITYRQANPKQQTRQVEQ